MYRLTDEKLAAPGDLILKTIGISSGSVGIVLSVAQRKFTPMYTVWSSNKAVEEWVYFFTDTVSKTNR